jgi:hypothetical protein
MKVSKLSNKFFLFLLSFSFAFSFAFADAWKTYTEGGDYIVGTNWPTFISNGYLYSCQGKAYFQTKLQPDGIFGEMTSFLTGNGLGLYFCAIATTGDWVYFAGGIIKYTEYPNSIGVYYTRINDNGYLENPVQTYDLRIGRAKCASMIVGDKFYVFGGYSRVAFLPGYALSSNEYGVIDTTYGGFTTTDKYTSSFSTISGTVFLAFNRGNRIYCLGEVSGTTGCYLEYADIQPDGSLGSWTTLQKYNFNANWACLTQDTTIFVVKSGISGIEGYPCAEMNISDGVIAGKSFYPVTASPLTRNGPTITTWDRFVYLLGGDAAASYDVYDPDMTGTRLFEENDNLRIQTSEIMAIPMELK